MSSSSALSMTCLQVSKVNVENHSVAFPFCVLRRKAATFEQLEKIRVPDWNFISTAIPLCGNSRRTSEVVKILHILHVGSCCSERQYMLCCLGPRLAGSTPNFAHCPWTSPQILSGTPSSRSMGLQRKTPWQCPCVWNLKNQKHQVGELRPYSLSKWIQVWKIDEDSYCK